MKIVITEFKTCRDIDHQTGATPMASPGTLMNANTLFFAKFRRAMLK
jgi:hypothetical protein